MWSIPSVGEIYIFGGRQATIPAREGKYARGLVLFETLNLNIVKIILVRYPLQKYAPDGLSKTSFFSSRESRRAPGELGEVSVRLIALLQGDKVHPVM